MNYSRTIAVISNTTWSLVNFRAELISGLLESGHTVYAVAPPDEYVSQIEAMGARFYPLSHLSAKGKNPIDDLKLQRELRSLFKRKKVDVAFTFTSKPNIYGSFAAMGTGTKVVPTVNGLGNAFIRPSKTQSIMRRLYKLSFRGAPKVIFQNPDDRDLFLEKAIVTNNQVILSPGSGVNLEVFQPNKDHPANPIVFLFSARLVSEKGVFEYLEAAREIMKSNKEIRFRLLGAPGNNPSSIKLNELDEYIEQGIVEYFGHTDDMNQELGNVSVLVLPSYYREGIPRVLLEGLAKGLPIITTDSTGCRETIIDGKNGIMIPPQDVGALIAAMERIIDLEEADRIEMGRQSRVLAEQKFDVKNVVAIYKEILNGWSARWSEKTNT